MKEIKILRDPAELGRVAAEEFVRIGRRAIGETGRFTVALAGGSTPQTLYQLLAGREFDDKLDWSRVFFFLGDERNVAPDDADSNFRMANENLLAPRQIAAQNVLRWPTETGNAPETAKAYAAAIGEFFASEKTGAVFPRFDLILLGMGDDGHTASLFPFTPALAEQSKIAAANPVAKLDAVRLTFTFPTINNAAHVIFLVAGAGKAAALRTVLHGPADPEQFPSQNVKPQSGELLWLIDEAAGRFLPR